MARTAVRRWGAIGERVGRRCVYRISGGGPAEEQRAVAGVVFGWTPEVFWNATPAELAALVRAAAGDEATPLSRGDIERLKEAFPDG